MSRIGLHPDWLCDRCEVPETVEYFSEVCTKFTEVRRRMKLAVEDRGINFSTPEILRSTAAEKHDGDWGAGATGGQTSAATAGFFL